MWRKKKASGKKILMHQVAKLMRDQGLQGDPKAFIPGYYKEINT